MLIPVLCAVCLAVVHVAADRIKIGARVSRRLWLSAASGASIAFVFLMLIPELVARQAEIAELMGVPTSLHHVWLLALAGLIAFYMAEHWMLTHIEKRSEPTHGAFWGHVAIFALYNAVMGYVLFDPHPEVVGNVLVYALALGLHLLVIDEAMRRHHPARYHQIGRWVMAAAVLTGAAAGLLTLLPSAVPTTALALLTGGIVLNALKEELPGEHESKIWAFAGGAAIYALVALWAAA